MPDFQVDLTNCDREPIHIPGQIQSHGFMIVLDQEGKIRFFSDNIQNFISGIEKNLLDKSIEYLESFFENSPLNNMLAQVLHLGRINGYEQINPYQVTILGKRFYLIISRSAQYEVLEFEPDGSAANIDVQKLIGRSVSEMLADKNLQNLLNNTAVQVKSIIHYDRVMIYRFADDGHGEVVAEARNEELESWLGLHYPASDIPKQARELYKLNLTRLIADVSTVPSKIFADPIQTDPLDLTWSQLRAVSPIHIQYLKNMGVASSFSISLIYKKELWGLVACHSYTPRFIDFKSRESAKLIGQILSSALEFRQDEENQIIQDGFKNALDILSKNLQSNDNIADALTADAVNILGLTQAAGAALIYEKKIIRLGITPSQEQIEKLVDWAVEYCDDQICTITNLSAIYPEAEAYRDVASGVLLCQLTKELKEYVIWFKPEHVQTIKWAGNPDKPVELNENGLLQISPRHSFEVWSQNVKGISESWRHEEVQSATRLKEEIIYAINLKAGALRLLNERLRVAYEELDSFSYTISHDLKNPIAAIKSYSQLLGRVKEYGDRERGMAAKIAERADQMSFMISEVLNYSRIGRQAIDFRKVNATNLISDIVKDLDIIYDTEKLKITIGETPDLQGDPLMILQIFSNLIGNAVKYSQDADEARVHIEGKASETEICYEVRDNGLGMAQADIPKIFELFNRLSNVSHIEGSGVGLAIVKRIIDKHKGRIWVESEPGAGSSFFVAFKR